MPSLAHERRLVAAQLLVKSAAVDDTTTTQETQPPPEEGAADNAVVVTTNNHAAATLNDMDDSGIRGDGCAADLARFCSRDANILTLLENAPTGIDAAQVTRAMKSVQLCMAKNVESLSPVCIEALVADLLSRKSTDAHAADALQPATYQGVPDSNNNNQYNRNAPADEDSSLDVSIHYSKHHNTAGGLRGAQPALTATAPAIAQNKQPGLSSGDMDIASPLMWLLVFPFFCIGLYVTYNHALVYVRRRKDALRIESKQYMPVP